MYIALHFKIESCTVEFKSKIAFFSVSFTMDHKDEEAYRHGRWKRGVGIITRNKESKEICMSQLPLSYRMKHVNRDLYKAWVVLLF